MDRKEGNQYLFNLKIGRLLGLYQILNPDTTKIYGCNVYHIIIWFIILITFAVTLLSPFDLYKRKNDPSAFTYHIGAISNVVLSSCKMINILYNLKDIWKSLDIANIYFLKYQYYNINIFKNWQNRTHRIVCAYFSIITIPYVTWTIIPFFITQPSINIKNQDGTYSVFRLNCFNFYLFVSDKLYNEYFYVFYSIDFVLITGFYYFSIIFDILVIWLCFAFSCHLETISDGIESLMNKKCPKELSGT